MRPVPSTKHRSRAFSLIELVLSAATVGVILAAAGGLIAAASRLVPRAGDPVNVDAQARAALQRLSADARLATSLRLESNKIELTLPDQNGDDEPESVVYTLNPAAGTLSRTWNTARSQVLASSVLTLDAVEQSNKVNTTEDAPAEHGSSTILAEYADALGDSAELSTTVQVGQFVQPRLPPDATAWRPTGFAVRLRARSVTALPLTVSLFAADSSGRPALLARGTALVPGGSLPNSDNWVAVSFPGLPEMLPSEGIAVTLAHAALVSTVTVPLERTRIQDANADLITSGLIGLGWSNFSSGSLNYRLAGTVKRPVYNIEQTTRARGLAVTLTVGRAAAPRTISTFARTLNAPELQ